MYSQQPQWENQWIEIAKETSKGRSILLNWLNRILAEDRPRWPDIRDRVWGIWSDILEDQISRVGNSLNWFCRLFAITEHGRLKMGLKDETSQKRGLRGAWLKFDKGKNLCHFKNNFLNLCFSLWASWFLFLVEEWTYSMHAMKEKSLGKIT